MSSSNQTMDSTDAQATSRPAVHSPSASHPRRPTRTRSDPLPVRSESIHRDGSPVAPNPDDTNWFDAPLAFALVPAIGSLLTGSDLLKDFLHLAFLLYYLHHLIKVPWELYTTARQRQSPYNNPLPDDHMRRLARSELRMAELTYLAFTVIAPFLGAILLRAVSRLLSIDSVSTFSTSLFVLATGVRPWRHLVDLLRHRTEALHDAVHLPSDDSIFSRVDALEEKLGYIQALLESRDEDSRQALGSAHTSLDQARKELKKVERNVDAARLAHETRLKELETAVETLKNTPLHTHGPAPPYGSVIPNAGPPSTTVSFTVPQSLADMVVKPIEKLVSFASPPRKTRELNGKMATSAEIVEIEDDEDEAELEYERKPSGGKRVTFAVVEQGDREESKPWIFDSIAYLALSPLRIIRHLASIVLDQLH